jgi:hypothetical protein
MKINKFDLIGATIVLASLVLIPQHRNWWLLYAFGCFLWTIIHYTKQLYFGMIMNTVAMIIGIVNYIKC